MIEVESTQFWLDRARATFDRFGANLLRDVATRLIRPRQQWSADELRDKMLAALDDPVATDRTLKTLSPHARQILRIIDLSRCPRWALQSLVDVLPALSYREGLAPIRELLDAGLLCPDLPGILPLESLDAWLEQAVTTPLHVLAVPQVTRRCASEPLHLDAPRGEKLAKLVPLDCDSLEWPLRAAVLWQSVRELPLRMTQNGGLFKRDLDRLRNHSIIGAAPANAAAEIRDPAIMALQFALSLGLLVEKGDEILYADFPSWKPGLDSVFSKCWSTVWSAEAWDPIAGYCNGQNRRHWLQSAGIIIVAALVETPSANWFSTDELSTWVAQRLPESAHDIPDVPAWCNALLLGLLQPMGAIDTAKTADGWRVRLTDRCRQMLAGERSPPRSNEFAQTLLVQPNLEIIVYRQGLTLELAATLTRIAEWKSLGAACTLVMSPESIYRGLESGLSADEIQRVLERHSSRPLSDSVIESLRSWASKRERVQVYSSAILLEFRTTADLDAAVKQGLVQERLTDRIGLVAGESQLDYSRFRLVGSRDYLAAEERCVEVGDDGLTLNVIDGKADLLLAAEVRRFADPLEPAEDDRTRYRASADSLRRARQAGVDLRWMEDWFARRTGFALPATAKLLFVGPEGSPLHVDRLVVLRMPNRELADGLERWSDAQSHIAERLGPTTFAVAETALPHLTKLLEEVGLPIATNNELKQPH